MCAIMKMGRPLLYQLPEQLPYHRDEKEWVSFITSQKMTVWCLFFLWYNIVALHHPGVRWRELLGSSWLRQGYLVQCIFQFLRLMGCPLKGTLNMMLTADRVNSFPELHREATQFKHRRLPCSCLHRKWMCLTEARSSVLAETATFDLPLGWWMAC